MNKIIKNNFKPHKIMKKSKEFIKSTLSYIVSNPDQIVIDDKTDEMGVLITVRVAKDDMGKIIGKQGATAQALRTLVRIVGMSENARVNLKIEEPNENN